MQWGMVVERWWVVLNEVGCTERRLLRDSDHAVRTRKTGRQAGYGHSYINASNYTRWQYGRVVILRLTKI